MSAMPTGPCPVTASVVIVNFNQWSFIGRAIESALRQRRAPIEVVVVDDGSTDGSRAVISEFGPAIRTVFKLNGGQASAINAGCRIAGGDVVFTLDSDDVLKPEAVEMVLARWRPETVMMQSRLDQIDSYGRRIRGTVPAPWIRLDEGNVVDRLLAEGTYSTTLTSGLAFRRDALERVLPVPEDRFRFGADGYLVRAIAFQGPVQAIQEPLGSYRRHADSYTVVGLTATQAAASFRRRLQFYRSEFDVVRSLAAARGLEAAADLGEHEPTYLLLRLFSVVVEPDLHPIPGDTPRRLLPAALAANLRARGVPLRRRLYTTLLAATVCLLPRFLARPLVLWWQSAASRPRWLLQVQGLLSLGERT